MLGGMGDDIFYVDAAGDSVVEGAGRGTDGVFSTITHTLAANVENLVLLASATPDIDGTGNELANALVGNADANVLSGLAGHDFLAGFAGNDTLIGGTGSDVLAGGAGDDLLTGDDGRDRFDFSGKFGHDVVADFDPGEGDRLAISGYGAALDQFEELKAFVSDNGIDTTIDLSKLGGGSILLAGFTGLQAGDVDLFA